MKQYDFIYITHARLPTEKAHGIQMVHSVNAFGRLFRKTLLLRARQPNHIRESIRDYYSLREQCFDTEELLVWNFFRGTRLGYWIRSVSFSVTASIYLLFHLPKILYSREPFPLLFFTYFRLTTVYEMHDFPTSFHWFNRFLCTRVSTLVTTNEWARNMCIEKYKISENKIVIAPNGYDAHLFKSENTKENCRQTLELPNDANLVLYSGSLATWKGVETFLAVANVLPEVIFILLGGSNKEQAVLREKFPAKNIIWRQHESQGKVPVYLNAADVLIIPNIPVTQHSMYSTSPIKLFEYMAMEKPVIASDLPSIKSIVGDELVTYFKAGSVQDLEEKIVTILSNPEESIRKAKRAREHVAMYEWNQRALSIKKALEKKLCVE